MLWSRFLSGNRKLKLPAARDEEEKTDASSYQGQRARLGGGNADIIDKQLGVWRAGQNKGQITGRNEGTALIGAGFVHKSALGDGVAISREGAKGGRASIERYGEVPHANAIQPVANEHGQDIAVVREHTNTREILRNRASIVVGDRFSVWNRGELTRVSLPRTGEADGVPARNRPLVVGSCEPRKI